MNSRRGNDNIDDRLQYSRGHHYCIAVIACLVVSTIIFATLFGFAENLFEILWRLIYVLSSNILDMWFMRKAFYYIMVTIIYLMIVIYVDWKIYHLLNPRRIVRNKQYIFGLFDGRGYGSPVPTRGHLIKNIYGKDRAPVDIREEINILIKGNVNPIKEFLGNKPSNRQILCIDAKWGAGKTTSLLIAINELAINSNRYIYESAFKYSGNIDEFISDLLSTLNDTMLELDINVSGIIGPLIRNLDSSPQKTFAGFIRDYGRMGNLSTDLTLWLNEQYKKSGRKNLIYIVIDDLDRVRGEDITSILSMLSILKNLKFVKIIIPADLNVINATLDKYGVVDSPRFIQKYLPSQTSLQLRSNYDMAERILLNKIHHAQKPQNIGGNEFCPTLAAIFIKMLAEKLREETRNYNNIRYTWLNTALPLSIPEANESVSQLMRAPFALRESLPSFSTKYNWNSTYNDIQKFQNIIYALRKKYGTSRNTSVRISEVFSEEEYLDVVDSWIFDYVGKRWDIFGFTIRDALDTLEGVNYVDIPKEPAGQFVYIFNQLFPEEQLKPIK